MRAPRSSLRLTAAPPHNVATVTDVPRWAPPFDPSVVRVVATILNPSTPPPISLLRGVDPEAFTYVARYWHVAPRLWLKLRHVPDVTPSVREPLRTEYWRNVHANSRLRVAASDLFATLNAQGVIPMVLKGACQLFDPPAGHAGTRFMVDLDLLAPPGQDRLCYDTLHALGFVPHLDTASSHHLPKLTKPCAGLDDGLAVEIHNTPWFGGGAAEAEAFFAASIRLENTVGQALLPCTVHRLLHNAVHTFHHGGITYYGVSEPDLDDAIGCTDLKQLLDFADLLWFRGDGIDWTWLRAEADRFDRTFELQQWSFLARELFGVQLPPDLVRWRVDREAPPTVQVQGRRAVRRVLRRAGLLDSARRLKRRWLG